MNFDKQYLSFPQELQFVKEDFQNKMLSRVNFTEVYHFGWFHVSLCKIELENIRIVGQYTSYGATRIQRILSLDSIL